ncbi:MAG: hypothetical protein K2W99_02355 [Chthoniobacterales bacterium]|nr:hypothetical protein [Chthoniobacterales bacterium]
MNNIPETKVAPNINAYWQFAADPKHAGKTVMRAEGAKIKVAPQLGKLGNNEISYLNSTDNLEYALNTADVVEHFKEALCNKYEKAVLRDLFSEDQEKEALCNGLTQETVKNVARKAAEIQTKKSKERQNDREFKSSLKFTVDAYWQFAADPKNVGKLVVETKEKELQFGDHSVFHPDSTENDIKFVDYHAIVDHFKAALCHRYGQKVLHNLLSKAQEEEARYNGLTYHIVKQVAENAKIVELFQQLKKYQDSIKKTLEEYKNKTHEKDPEKQVQHMLFLAEKIKFFFSKHLSLVQQFQAMIAADPANIILQIKSKSSYLTFQEKYFVEIAQLSLDAVQKALDMATKTQEENLPDVALSPKGKTASISKILEHVDQAREIFGVLILLQAQAPAVISDFLTTHQALINNIERKIAEIPGDSQYRLREALSHAP